MSRDRSTPATCLPWALIMVTSMTKSIWKSNLCVFKMSSQEHRNHTLDFVTPTAPWRNDDEMTTSSDTVPESVSSRSFLTHL